jgi:hypothetical protein
LSIQPLKADFSMNQKEIIALELLNTGGFHGNEFLAKTGG